MTYPIEAPLTDLSHLAKPPFNLDTTAIEWVEKTWESLDLSDRVGQLFNLLSMGNDETELAKLSKLKLGGITRFFGSNDVETERKWMRTLQASAKVPMLVSADLEGSRMSLTMGTQTPNPLALAAIDDEAITREVSTLMAREARAVGINWSFTPVLDINAATRSPIVPTRGFGTRPEGIARHALTQIRAFQENGVAATAKHWPGEGHDDRDQHLVTTIIPLSVEEWEATHGKLYRQAIDSGVLAVMSAHIAFPAFARESGMDESVELYRPASINALLNNKLLREKLGFNGLIVSDASEMSGLTAFMEARKGKVEIINAGCDMILFSHNPEADIAAVHHAVETGEISATRFRDAVTRILGLKAALGLHKGGDAIPDTEITPQTERMAEILRRAPVLEKDVNNTLPLDPRKHKRVLMFAPGIIEPLRNEKLPLVLPELLEKEGFEVTLYKPGDFIDPSAHDVAIYAFAEESLLTRGRIFLDWRTLGGGLYGAMRRIWFEIPTVMISFGYPYYLYDAPRAPTYINAWATMDPMQEAVVDLLLGRAEWNRKSPVDAFSGAPDARY